MTGRPVTLQVLICRVTETWVLVRTFPVSPFTTSSLPALVEIALFLSAESYLSSCAAAWPWRSFSKSCGVSLGGSTVIVSFSILPVNVNGS